MTDLLKQLAEEKFGINANPDDIEKLKSYILKTHTTVNREILDKVFLSGEAAGFLTVGETYFFREPAHFSFLMELLPEYENKITRICSAAVASGCEAYSIAMLIESYNKRAKKPVLYHIDAFDINPAVIETAAKGGAYSVHSLREDGSCFRYMSDPFLEKTSSGYQVDGSLRKNIRFFVHNLMDDLPFGVYDFLFFRNAFIYFSHRKREKVLSNLHSALKEGGILFMGVSETAGVHYPGLEDKNQNDVFYFRKTVL